MKKRILFSLALLLSPALSHTATPTTQREMREASKKMTAKEMKNMENYLKNWVKKAADDDEKAKREKIFQSFYKGRYDLVMEELKALGENPQRILKTTGLREKMLSGELERTAWFMREIAGLDWFFSNDAKKQKNKRQWPTRKDWVQHLTNLADQVVRNHRRVEDAQMLEDAINDMTNRLEKHKNRMNAVFKRQINNTLKRLKDIKR